MKILITGATGGIGSQLAKNLIQKHRVVAVGRNKKNLNDLKTKIKSKNLIIKQIDVSNPNQVRRLFSSIKSLNVLINCAGILKPVGKLLDNNLDDWKKTIEINLLGTVYCCYYALPLLLKAKKRGKIINFSGGGGAYGRSYHSAYACSKTAVIRFTETLASEYPQIDINAIAPGPHKTGMWKDEAHDKEPKQWGDMKRLKGFINYLLSQKSDGITGRFIHYKDDWGNFDPNKLSKEIYTLRRIEK